MAGLGSLTDLPPAQLRWVRPMGRWLRWGALGFVWVLVVAVDQPADLVVQIGATVVLGGFVAWRSTGQVGALAELRTAVSVEPAIALLCVLATGGWASPFTLYLAVPVLFATLGVGRVAFLLVPAIAAVLTVHELVDGDAGAATEVTQTLVPLVIAAAVGLGSRSLVGETDVDHAHSLGRINQLSHVNALLSTLHDLVRSTPAPLTVEDVLRVIRSELDELFEADSILLLLAGEGGRWWRPVALEGAAVGREIAYADLPAELLAEGPGQTALQIPRLGEGTGLSDTARSGAYLWLWSRGQPAALLALEHDTPRELSQPHLDMLQRMSAPLGLAIDNAIWFQRLRTLGAEEERQRIGAQLHDQFAQSLAYVKMELDRLAPRYQDDEALSRLQGEVHRTLSDLRETLRELRLRCTEARGLVPTLQDHVERFGDRYGVMTRFEADATAPRPPLTVENQVLRMAQDLLVLAQRESGATSLSVSLTSEPGRLRLVVHDDGFGVPEDRLGHEASSILSVVRQRADAIGGLVDVVTREGEGNNVAVTVRGL